MRFIGVELNADMKSNLDTFFESAVIGEKVDFINKPRENPNPAESCPIIPKELTDEQTLEVLRKTNHRIWGY